TVQYGDGVDAVIHHLDPEFNAYLRNQDDQLIQFLLQRASIDTTKETGKWSATSIRITLTDWMVSGCSIPPNVVVREVMLASAPMFASLHLAHTEQPVSREEGNFASEGTQKKP
uniref:Uncharacterized protein n=1 Tax=Echinococcus canadensis TaxID=519352 RepID=A0A915EYR5_9CEST